MRAHTRILIVRACAIGDFVLNLPALRALAETHPAARCTLVGYPANLVLATQFIEIDAIHSIELQPWCGLLASPLQNLDFDAAYVWMKDDRIAENLRRSGIPEVYYACPFPATGHAANHLLDTVGLPAPELPDLWDASGRIIIHPGSGSPTKRWPYFEQLVARIPDAVSLIGPCETTFRTPGSRLEGLSLQQVVKELRSCRVYLGNDSGITHIAAYWGCPTVALFGPTDPRVWGPVGRRVKVLWKSSLADISIEEVIEEVRELI